MYILSTSIHHSTFFNTFLQRLFPFGLSLSLSLFHSIPPFLFHLIRSPPAFRFNYIKQTRRLKSAIRLVRTVCVSYVWQKGNLRDLCDFTVRYYWRRISSRDSLYHSMLLSLPIPPAYSHRLFPSPIPIAFPFLFPYFSSILIIFLLSISLLPSNLPDNRLPSNLPRQCLVVT